MPTRPLSPANFDFRLTFGGGLQTRQSETDIQDIECADGENFDLDLDNNDFRRRLPFDLAGTATNTQPVQGFAQLIKSTGQMSTLVQAGPTVYEWDGVDSFTSRGTVSGGARLRGPISQNFLLDDVAIITDLAETQPVLVWDGTTLSEMTHNLGGNFFARYAAVDRDRAFYANVRSGTATPHLLVGSTREDYDSLTVSTRASSSLSAADPFFLTSPDLRPIKGLLYAFNTLVFPTLDGELWRLTGADASDFAITGLGTTVDIEGEEAIAFIGNDIAYGSPGRIETMFATQNLGETETDDLTREIKPDIEDISDWIVRYEPRSQRVFFFNPDGSQLFVYHKAIPDEALRRIAQQRSTPSVSPWSRWKTAHAMSFQPTSSFVMRDPVDGLSKVFMGGSAGEIWRMDGVGGQDGGTSDITAFRTSKFFAPPAGGPVFDVDGLIRYRKNVATTVTITFLIGGEAVADQSLTVSLPAISGASFFGGDAYFGGDFYFGVPFEGRLSLQNFDGPSPQGSGWQIKVAVTGAAGFFIESLYLNFRTE